MKDKANHEAVHCLVEHTQKISEENKVSYDLRFLLQQNPNPIYIQGLGVFSRGIFGRKWVGNVLERPTLFASCW